MSPADEAVAAHLAFFAQTETRAADPLFRQSAIQTAQALARGVPALLLAQLYADSTRHLKAAKNMPAYTSRTAVGYHARTGRLLLKPSPEAPASAREVQTAVRTATQVCGARLVDMIIESSDSQAAAYRALHITVRNRRAEEQGRTTEVGRTAADGEADLLKQLSAVERLLDRGVVTDRAADWLDALASRAGSLLEERSA